MRKESIKTVCAAVIICVMLFMLAGCGKSTFSTTSAGNKTTIKVNEATDGASGEGPIMSVGKNKTITITSELENGQLTIDFVEVINMKESSDDVDDYVYLDTAQSITVGPGDSTEISLPAGEYSYQFTAIGDTSGTVTVNIG